MSAHPSCPSTPPRFSTTSQPSHWLNPGGARRHDGFLADPLYSSSVTSRNALCENAIGLNEPGRVCHRGSTAGRWKPAPIRCTVQACALVAGLRRPLGHGKLHPYCFERQHGGIVGWRCVP